MPKEKLYREDSLKKLASPDNLDKLITVTDSKGWLSLLAVLGLILVTIVWSILGEVPTKVSASGILIRSGGIRAIQHSFGGSLTDMSVIEGMSVKKGDVLARLASNEMLEQISNQRQELDSLKLSYQRYQDFFNKNKNLKESVFIQSKKTREENLKDLEREILDQKSKIKAQENLLAEGGISKEELRASLQELDRLETSKDNILNEIKQLHLDESSYLNDNADTIIKLRNIIAEKEEAISYAKDQLDYHSKIVSPFTGKIVSVLVSKGSVISPGQDLMTIEIDGDDVKNLEGKFFLPAMEGKKVKIGMNAQVVPSTVNDSEYGTMVGKVTKVSSYPATYAYMTKLLGEDLAKSFARIPDPIEVVVDLVPDTDTISGFKWSSRKGPPIDIRTGTPSEARIKIKSIRPISLVFPIFERVFGARK